MKKVTIYEAEDGARFNTESGCLEYEKILNQVSSILDTVWHPGADNHLFNMGRMPVQQATGSRQMLIDALLPIMQANIKGPQNDYLEWFFSYTFSNPSAYPCLVKAHRRIMSIDSQDREWCDPETCRIIEQVGF